uniref:GAE domain-containing protein n=1 Tax=Chloropicon laureae TaxID=464258 RepID=A0A7S2Z772_9CHLO
MGDLLSLSPAPAAAAPAAPAAAAAAPAGGFDPFGLDMLGGGGAPAAPAAPAFPTTTPYQKNGLAVEFSFEKNPATPAVTVIHGKYTNTGTFPVTNFIVQVAVPNYIQLRMEPASGNALPPQGAGHIAQKINLNNTVQGQKPLMMRLKVDYVFNGAPVSEIVEVKNFPQGI